MLRFTCQFVHRSSYPSDLISHHIIAINYFLLLSITNHSIHPYIFNHQP